MPAAIEGGDEIVEVAVWIRRALDLSNEFVDGLTPDQQG
jgi:hypothetical protein